MLNSKVVDKIWEQSLYGIFGGTGGRGLGQIFPEIQGNNSSFAVIRAFHNSV